MSEPEKSSDLKPSNMVGASILGLRTFHYKEPPKPVIVEGKTIFFRKQADIFVVTDHGNFVLGRTGYATADVPGEATELLPSVDNYPNGILKIEPEAFIGKTVKEVRSDDEFLIILLDDGSSLQYGWGYESLPPYEDGNDNSYKYIHLDSKEQTDAAEAAWYSEMRVVEGPASDPKDV